MAQMDTDGAHNHNEWILPMRLFFAFTLFVLSAFPAAAFDQDDAAELLFAGDFAALEAKFREFDALARETGDYTPLFNIQHTFSFSDRRRLDGAQAWLQEYPGSVYAMAAFAAASSNAAFEYRGSDFVQDTPSEAFLKFRERIYDAAIWAETAFQIDPHYAPGAVEHITSHIHLPHEVDIHQIVSTTFETYMRQYVLEGAVETSGWKWGGDPQNPVKLCAKWGDKIPDFSAEACLAIAVLRDAVEYRDYGAAFDTLEKLKDQNVGYWRLQRLMYRVSTPLDVYADLFEVHKARKGKQGTISDLDDYKLQGARLASAMKQPEYADEVQAYFDETIAKALVRNPNSIDIITANIERLQLEYRKTRDRAHLDDAREIWAGALPYGMHRDEVWTVRGIVELSYGGPDYGPYLAFPFLSHAAAISADPSWPMGLLLNGQHGAYRIAKTKAADPNRAPHFKSDPAKVAAFYTCPMLRTARLFLKHCLLNPRGVACSGYGFDKAAIQISQDREINYACLDVAQSRLSDLQFPTFTPQALEAWVANTPPF